MGEKVAGVAGLALLIIMFAFDWFTVDVGGGFADISVGGNAWDTMELIRFIILLAALAGIALAAISASDAQVDLPMSTIAAGLGILAVVLILYRLIDPPGGEAEEFGVDIGRGIGAFLGLIAAAGVAAGGWMAMQEEGTSFKEQADRLGGGGGGGPGGPPPPPPPPTSGTGGPPPPPPPPTSGPGGPAA
jgi:hypothetical protein